MKAIRKGKSILDHELAVGDLLLVQWNTVPRLLTLKIINHVFIPYFFSANEEEITPEIASTRATDLTELFDCGVDKLIAHFAKQKERKIEILHAIGGSGFQCYRVIQG